MTSPFFTADEVRNLAPHGDTIFKNAAIYIFGAGNTGRDFLERLRRIGQIAAGFIDNNPALANKEIEGHPILMPCEFAKRHRDAFVIVAAAVSNRILTQCRELGIHNAMTLGDFIQRHGCTIEFKAIAEDPEAIEAINIWDEEESKQTYRSLVRYRVTFDTAELPPPEPDHYFNVSVVRRKDLRAYVDCGAFVGDTLQGLRKASGDGFEHYYGFEASAKNFAAAVAVANSDPRTVLFNVAVSNCVGRMRYFADQGSLSRLSEHGTTAVDAIRLEEALDNRPVTMIKMDVEGSEPEALEGALGLIRTQRPALAISVYHYAHHLWSIPLWIKRLGLGYRLRLMHHGRGHYGETVCYAIPEKQPCL